MDTIADMLTRIRNASARSHKTVSMPSSKHKIAVLDVLKREGYIDAYTVSNDPVKPTLSVSLKYKDFRPVIAEIQKVSKPGRRVYVSFHDMPRVKNGLGIAVVSTSQGVFSDTEIRRSEKKAGGELICYVF